MKNFKILPYLLVLFCSMFSILACNKESLSLIDSYTSADSVEESAIKDIFYKRKESAKILSIILQDNSITQKIAQECQKRLCQETEILFADVLKIKNAEGLTLQEVFKTKYSYAADELLKNDPLLCIYHYGDSKQLSKLNRVYVDKVLDKHKQNEAVIYFENGVEKKTNISDVPKFDVFVLKTNERTYAVDLANDHVAYLPSLKWSYLSQDYYFNLETNKVEYEKDYLTSVGRFRIYNKYKTPLQGLDLNKDKPKLTERGCSTGLDRDCLNGYEVISCMKWVDHREPWTKGGPEWVVRHALGSLASPYVANPQLSLYVGADQRYSMRRSNNPQTTTDANIYLTDMQLWRWNLLNQTKEAYIYVYEDDGGLKSVSLALPVLKGTFGIKDVFGATVNTELTVGGGNVTWLVGDDQVGGVVLYYENNWQDHDDLQARTYGYPIIVGGNITMYCKERSW